MDERQISQLGREKNDTENEKYFKNSSPINNITEEKHLSNAPCEINNEVPTNNNTTSKLHKTQQAQKLMGMTKIADKSMRIINNNNSNRADDYTNPQEDSPVHNLLQHQPLQQAELEEESSTRLSSSNSNNKTTTKLNVSTQKISKSIPDTTEKKTNKNTIRVNEEKNISKVTPPVIHTNYNNTNNIFTYDTVKKYSSKVDRNKDQKKRQEEAQYYLPEFLRENEKTNIQDCNSKLNSVASTSENVDLPHKRYSSK